MHAASLHTELAALLQSFETISGQGGVFHGLHDRTVILGDRLCAFCRYCLSHPVAADFCRFTYRNATVHALSSGEPYFYRCWAGLLFVSIPVAPHNVCCGGLSVGGFYGEGEAADVQHMVTQALGGAALRDREVFLSHESSLRPITPSALRGLGFLALEATFSSGLNSSSFFKTQNEKYLQQRRIAEAYADMREAQPVDPPDVLADAYQLVVFLEHNDQAKALEFMSRYLARLLMASNWDLTKLKAHVRVLLAIMTSRDILAGAPWAAATSRELRYLVRLEQSSTTEAVCYEVAEWIQHHFRSPERPRGDGRSLSERTLAWIQVHYQDRATLAGAARSVGAGVSTLVHHLKRNTGKTFKALLHEVRIAEAKKLLATTSLEISDIAARCGYFDQSHFTRELNRAINLTPGRFRRLLHLPEEALRAPPVAPPRLAKKKGGKRRVSRP